MAKLLDHIMRKLNPAITAATGFRSPLEKEIGIARAIYDSDMSRRRFAAEVKVPATTFDTNPEEAARLGAEQGRASALAAGAGDPVRTAKQALAENALDREVMDQLDAMPNPGQEDTRPAGGVSLKFRQEMEDISLAAQKRKSEQILTRTIPTAKDRAQINLRYTERIKLEPNPEQKRLLAIERDAKKAGQETPFMTQKQSVRDFHFGRAAGITDPAQLGVITKGLSSELAEYNKTKAAYLGADEINAPSLYRELVSRRDNLTNLYQAQGASLAKDKALDVRGKTAAIKGQEQRTEFATEEERRAEDAAWIRLNSYLDAKAFRTTKEATRKTERGEDIRREDEKISDANTRFWTAHNTSVGQFDEMMTLRKQSMADLAQSRKDADTRSRRRAQNANDKLVAQTAIQVQRQVISGLIASEKDERENIASGQMLMAKIRAEGRVGKKKAGDTYKTLKDDTAITYAQAYESARAMVASARSRIDGDKGLVAKREAAQKLADDAAAVFADILKSEEGIDSSDPDRDTRTIEQVGEDSARDRIDRQISISQASDYAGAELIVPDADWGAVFNSMLRTEKDMPEDEDDPKAKARRVSAKMKAKYKGHLK